MINNEENKRIYLDGLFNGFQSALNPYEKRADNLNDLWKEYVKLRQTKDKKDG